MFALVLLGQCRQESRNLEQSQNIHCYPPQLLHPTSLTAATLVTYVVSMPLASKSLGSGTRTHSSQG